MTCCKILTCSVIVGGRGSVNNSVIQYRGGTHQYSRNSSFKDSKEQARPFEN